MIRSSFELPSRYASVDHSFTEGVAMTGRMIPRRVFASVPNVKDLNAIMPKYVLEYRADYDGMVKELVKGLT